ncbi:MAG: universal stress protein [Actinomycetota bacterium]|nr:universal stress protein [Actinomycetota bacterium]
MAERSDPRAGRIVVGVDGSDASKDALAWAARQAELTGASIQVVTAWHVPMAAYSAAVSVPTGYEFEQQARKVLDATIVAVLGDQPNVQVTTSVVEGHPAPELLAAAAAAELLVVGSRGHGAFTGMLLGSVSEHCVTHAPCPVVVVRHSPQPA